MPILDPYLKKIFYPKIKNYSFKLIFCIVLIFFLGTSCNLFSNVKGKNVDNLWLTKLIPSNTSIKSLYGSYTVSGNLDVVSLKFFPFHIESYTRKNIKSFYYYSRPDKDTLRICSTPNTSLKTFKDLAKIRAQLCNKNGNSYLYQIKNSHNNTRLTLKNMTNRSLFGYHKNDVLLERNSFETLFMTRYINKALADNRIALISQDNIILTIKGNPMQTRTANLYHLDDAEMIDANKISINATMTPNNNTIVFNIIYCGERVKSGCNINRPSTYRTHYLDEQKIIWIHQSGNLLFNKKIITFWIPSVIPPTLKDKLGVFIKSSLEKKKYQRLINSSNPNFFTIFFDTISDSSPRHKLIFQWENIQWENKNSEFFVTFGQNATTWDLIINNFNISDGDQNPYIFFNFNFDKFVIKRKGYVQNKISEGTYIYQQYNSK